MPIVKNLRDLLSEERLRRLRAEFRRSNDKIADLALLGIGGMHPEGAAALGGVVAHLYPTAHGYKTSRLSERDRELCLVMMAASRMERFPFAVHTYWALMEGVTVAELLDLLFLVAAYEGIDEYNETLTWLERLLQLLASSSHIEPRPLLGEFKRNFGTSWPSSQEEPTARVRGW